MYTNLQILTLLSSFLRRHQGTMSLVSSVLTWPVVLESPERARCDVDTSSAMTPGQAIAWLAYSLDDSRSQDAHRDVLNLYI